MKTMAKSKYFNDERAVKAQEHIQKMSKKYSEDILEIVYASTIYMEPLDNKVNKATTKTLHSPDKKWKENRCCGSEDCYGYAWRRVN